MTDATHLVLNSPGISGMRQGQDGLTITTSYWNHSGWIYGDSHNGSHDIHANPLFVDSNPNTLHLVQGEQRYASFPVRPTAA